MDMDKMIAAEWLSPCRLKRWFFLNTVISCMMCYSKYIFTKLAGYNVSGCVFLAGETETGIAGALFLWCGILSFLAGIAMNVLAFLAIHEEALEKNRLITLLLLAAGNMMIAVLLIVL